jgi:CDP-diacylglycerol--glycerol-3-phosphate 3-phosphatidyltransferase
VEDAREKPRKVYDTFTDWARDVGRVITVPVARFLAGLGIHPNAITILGLLLSVGVAALMTTGRLILSGWLLLLVVPMDAIDGALARFVGQKSRFGAFLDSTLDRLCEAVLLGGLAIYYLRQGDSTEVILAFVALVGGTLVSYTRARAEALGFSCKVGLLTRLERAAVLIIALGLGYPRVGLWVLAVGTNLTALHRILHVYRLSRNQEAKM